MFAFFGSKLTHPGVRVEPLYLSQICDNYYIEPFTTSSQKKRNSSLSVPHRSPVFSALSDRNRQLPELEAGRVLIVLFVQRGSADQSLTTGNPPLTAFRAISQNAPVERSCCISIPMLSLHERERIKMLDLILK